MIVGNMRRRFCFAFYLCILPARPCSASFTFWSYTCFFITNSPWSWSWPWSMSWLSSPFHINRYFCFKLIILAINQIQNVPTFKFVINQIWKFNRQSFLWWFAKQVQIVFKQVNTTTIKQHHEQSSRGEDELVLKWSILVTSSDFVEFIWFCWVHLMIVDFIQSSWFHLMGDIYLN